MSFPNQDYLAMLKAKPQMYPQMQQTPQAQMIYQNPQFMYVNISIFSSTYTYYTIQQSYMNYAPQYFMMQQLQQMQQMQQIPSMSSLGPLRMPFPNSQPQMQPHQQMVMPFPIQPPNPAQPKTDQNLPVQVKGTKVKLNLKMIKDIPQEEDSLLDYDEIKKQSGDRQFINLKRKRRLLDQQDAPLMQTRRRSEQSQYLEIRDMLNVDDKDMTLIMEAYPDTKSLLQELKNGNLKSEIEDLLLK